MFGNSTDVLMRRVMLRVVRPIFILSFLCIGLMLLLPWLPPFAPEWLYFISSFYVYVLPFSIGGLGVLITVECGKIGCYSRWDPPTTWICFFVYVSAVIASLLMNLGIMSQQVGLEIEEAYVNSFTIGTIVMVFTFLAKFSSVVSRQKIFERIYFCLLIITTGILFWSFLKDVTARHGNPFEQAPWKETKES